MRITTGFLAAAAFAAVVATERPCPAMSSSELTDTAWSATYQTTLRVTRVGRESGTTSGSVAFASDGTFAASEDDGGVLRTYTGTWRMNGRGRVLRMRLDANGKAALRQAIADWIEATAADEGVTLENLRIRLARATLKNARPPETTGPFSTRLSADGNGSARVGNRRFTATIHHRASVSLSP